MRIKREDFLTQLESVRPGLSEKEMHQQDCCFIFKDGKLITFNDELSCSLPTKFEIKGAVRAAPLVSVLDKMSEREIDVTQNGKELLLKGLNKKAGIAMDQEINLPLEHVEKTTKWLALPQNFCEAANLIRTCVSKDTSEYIRTCVHITPKFLEACDNDQLARYPLRIKLKSPILIKGAFLKHVIEADSVKFCVGEAWAHFKNKSNLIVSCRISKDKYPVLGKYYKVSGSPITLPKGIAEAAERAQTFSIENVDRNRVSIELKRNAALIRGEGVLGWYEEIKKLKYSGPEIRFTIDPKLLVDIVSRNNECEITEDRLKIDTGSYRYISCLGKVDEKKKE